MNLERSYNRRQMWKAILSVCIMTFATACFVMAMIVSLVLTGRE